MADTQHLLYKLVNQEDMGGMSEKDWMGGFSYYFAQPAAVSSSAG